MKRRWPLLIALALLCSLLLGGLVLAQGDAKRTAPAYIVEQGTAAGEGYRLAGGTWRVSGAASGLDYWLQGQQILQPINCCCAWLPCIFDNHTP